MDPLAFAPFSVLLALTPGPNNLCAMNNGLRAGTYKALVATWGRVAAFAIFLCASAIGLGAMLLASETAFTAIKWLGAAYLLWLGWNTWHSKDASIFYCMATQNAHLTTRHISLKRMIAQEFTLAITNPKAVILFAAIFPQFLDPNQPAAQQFLVLGSLYLAAEFISTAVYATFGKFLKKLIQTPRHALCLNRAIGGLFMGAGGVLMGVQK
jgi:homoserine/homoserine lactone efflux protein